MLSACQAAIAPIPPMTVDMSRDFPAWRDWSTPACWPIEATLIMNAA